MHALGLEGVDLGTNIVKLGPLARLVGWLVLRLRAALREELPKMPNLASILGMQIPLALGNGLGPLALQALDPDLGFEGFEALLSGEGRWRFLGWRRICRGLIRWHIGIGSRHPSLGRLRTVSDGSDWLYRLATKRGFDLGVRKFGVDIATHGIVGIVWNRLPYSEVSHRLVSPQRAAPSRPAFADSQ
jgi:hypothetical protein